MPCPAEQRPPPSQAVIGSQGSLGGLAQRIIEDEQELPPRPDPPHHRQKEIYTQEELARELGSVGIQTTQVTLSRDIRDLGLVKTAEGYRPSPEEAGRNSPISWTSSCKIFALRKIWSWSEPRPATPTRSPSPSTKKNSDEVVGTVAGDDTILVITPDSATAAEFRQKLLELIS